MLKNKYHRDNFKFSMPLLTLILFDKNTVLSTYTLIAQ